MRSQTYRDYEIVLFDVGSTDGTHQLAHLADVYQRTPPRGCAHARNTAMGLARGDYLYVLDSDDFLAPNALELSVETIGQSGADMVFFDLLVVKDGRVAGLWRTREQTVEEVIEQKRIPDGSAMVRRSTLDVQYDETLPSAEDLDFLLRYLPGKSVRKLAEPVYYYRLHDGQESCNPVQRETARWIRERWKRQHLTR